MDNLLEVRGLKTHFHTDRGLFRAVAHSYVAQRALVDAVPTEALQLGADRTIEARALLATGA